MEPAHSEVGGGGPADERRLRQAAEAGDPDSAYRLGELLAGAERLTEAEPWLRMAVHSDRGVDAAFQLGLAASELERVAEAERWWLLAAHGGSLTAAYNLAGLLEGQERPDEAGYWYRKVAESGDVLAFDAARRLDERWVEDRFRELARGQDGPGFWRLLLSRPITEAVRAARHFQDLRWRPDGGHDRALAERLLAEDTGVAARVVDRAARLATRIVSPPLDFAGKGSAERIAGEPLLILAQVELLAGAEAFRYRLTKLDPAGREASVYTGSQSHASVGCLADETVVAVRSASHDDSGRTTFHWELVIYRTDGERRIADGPGVPFPRVVTTRDGFIVGLQMTADVILGHVDRPPRVVDLSPTGRWRRTDRVAVDPTGTRVGFGDDEQLMVVDSHLQRLIATSAARPDQVHGPLEDVVFVTTDEVVTSGRTGMCRWRIEQDQLVPRATVGTRAFVSDLFVVPAWGIVAGKVNGPNLTFFDAESLAPAPTPAAVIKGGWNIIRTMNAAPGGRFVVYSGYIGGDEIQDADQPREVTVIHDLWHPLAWAHRPPATLTRSDLDKLAGQLAGRPVGPGIPAHALDDDERRVLELVRAAAECHLAASR